MDGLRQELGRLLAAAGGGDAAPGEGAVGDGLGAHGDVGAVGAAGPGATRGPAALDPALDALLRTYHCPCTFVVAGLRPPPPPPVPRVSFPAPAPRPPPPPPPRLQHPRARRTGRAERPVRVVCPAGLSNGRGVRGGSGVPGIQRLPFETPPWVWCVRVCVMCRKALLCPGDATRQAVVPSPYYNNVVSALRSEVPLCVWGGGGGVGVGGQSAMHTQAPVPSPRPKASGGWVGHAGRGRRSCLCLCLVPRWPPIKRRAVTTLRKRRHRDPGTTATVASTGSHSYWAFPFQTSTCHRRRPKAPWASRRWLC